MSAFIFRSTPRLVALVLAFAGNAWAACASTAVVFSCVTAKDKVIEVCEAKDHFEYSYGRSGAAKEIKVRASKTKAPTLSWRGPDRWQFYSMDIPNGRTVYNVYLAINSDKPHVAAEGGVNVVTADAVTATVACNPKRIVQRISNLAPVVTARN